MADFVEAQVSEDLSSRDRADEDFRTLFEAAYGPVVRTLWLVVHDRALADRVGSAAATRSRTVRRRVREASRWARRMATRRTHRSGRS